eukprot:1153441-Ditylum_brightwellii.AAC.1
MQEMYATVVSRCMEITKHDKDTKIFMKIRGEYIIHSTLEKYGHPTVKYHSDKESPELFIPPNSTDRTHLKGQNCGTATHTVALLPGKEIT